MKNYLLDVWQVDINKSYWVDEDMNIWKSLEAFYEYYLEDYHGTKDNYELWQEDVAEEHNLLEYSGSEVIKMIFDDMQETIEWYRNDRNK